MESRIIDQRDARRVVAAELDKFGQVMAAKFKNQRELFQPNPAAQHILQCALTLDDLRASGLTFSASVLDPELQLTWGRDGKF